MAERIQTQWKEFDIMIQTLRPGSYLLISANDVWYDDGVYKNVAPFCEFVVQVVSVTPSTSTFWRGYQPGNIIVRRLNGSTFPLFTGSGYYHNDIYYRISGNGLQLSKELRQAVEAYQQISGSEYTIHVSADPDPDHMQEVAAHEGIQEIRRLDRLASEQRRAQGAEQRRLREEEERHRKKSEAIANLDRLFNKK